MDFSFGNDGEFNFEEERNAAGTAVAAAAASEHPSSRAFKYPAAHFITLARQATASHYQPALIALQEGSKNVHSTLNVSAVCQCFWPPRPRLTGAIQILSNIPTIDWDCLNLVRQGVGFRQPYLQLVG